MELLTPAYYEAYKKRQRYTLHKHLRELSGKRSVALYPGGPQLSSSIFSSLIEGSSIDPAVYWHNKETGHQSRAMQQIDDLVEAYTFAKGHALTLANLLKGHAMLGRNLEVAERYKGTLRDLPVRVGNLFRTVYVGAPADIVAAETKRLFSDIAALKKRKLTTEQAFYYAAMIHLVFVKIHPFADGNGRAARLLEKWFLAQHTGAAAWLLPSEANYYVKRPKYYDNLDIGGTYDAVNYDLCVPFLLMLPACFSLSKKYYTQR